MRQTYTSEKRLRPEGKGSGAVKLAPLRRRRRGERGAVKHSLRSPLRRRSRGEQPLISQASKAGGLWGLSLRSSRAEQMLLPGALGAEEQWNRKLGYSITHLSTVGYIDGYLHLLEPYIH